MERMKVIDLKTLAKERGLRGYSKLKKAELITFLQNNLQLRTRPTRTKPPKPTRAPSPPPTWEPIDDRLKPTPPSVRPRQPSDSQNLEPYQLKPKRGFIEPPMKQEPPLASNQKQIKHMKKKLGKLNKKVRHSKKKHNNLVSKRNSIKKKIEELKGSRESHKPEESFIPIEHEQAFRRAYRSYRINGRPRMDVDTFINRIRQNLIDLMDRELGSAKVQMTTWIRFRQALEDDFGNVIGFDRVEKPFNSRMTEIFQGSD